MKAERRIAARKVVDLIHVAELTSLSSYSVIAREAYCGCLAIRFSSTIDRGQLVPKEYRENLDMSGLIGHQVVMFLPQMNLDLDGTITRAAQCRQIVLKLLLNFRPTYLSIGVIVWWNCCPAPGEILDEDVKN